MVRSLWRWMRRWSSPSSGRGGRARSQRTEGEEEGVEEEVEEVEVEEEEEAARRPVGIQHRHQL